MDGDKAVGIDGVTKEDYGKNLEENLDDLLGRMLSCRAWKPVMPKTDSKTKRQVMNYLAENDATKEKRREVWQWVHHGIDVYSNPWFYAWSGGYPMDLISELRFDSELNERYDSMTPDEREVEFGYRDTPIMIDDL